MCKEDCIFRSIYRDHGSSTPLCTRFSSDLSSCIKDLVEKCPCNCFITSSIVAELQDDGDIYIDYCRRFGIQK